MDEIAYANFVCPKCGPTTITVEDKSRDDSVVSCKGCGIKFEQTWGEVKHGAAEATKEALTKPLRDGFKRGGWK